MTNNSDTDTGKSVRLSAYQKTYRKLGKRLRKLEVRTVAALEAEDWEWYVAGDSDAGRWHVTGPWEYTVAAATGPFKVSGVRVEPKWSDGDSVIMCEDKPQAAYVAAADPRTIHEMLELLRKLDTYAGHREWCDLDQSYGTHECTCGYGDIASAIPS